jgi:hypothetical protein
MARVAPALSLSLALFSTAVTGVAHEAASEAAPPASIRAALSVPDRSVSVPEDGQLSDGVYRNRYFDLAYPLPEGWKEGLQGPPPSYFGSYVLATPIQTGEPKATILIAAQDMFFAPPSMANATAMVDDLRHATAESSGLKAQTGPRKVTIAGHEFARVDLRGPVLSRVVLATGIRCHIVSFTFASSDPQLLERLVASLDALSLPPEATATGTGASAAGSPVPVCIKGHARPETILHRVEPAPLGPKFLKIPVRIVIGSDGRVKHTHVIRAFPMQAKSIEEALAAWRFKPYELGGRPVEVETGLVFEFKPTR